MTITLLVYIAGVYVARAVIFVVSRVLRVLPRRRKVTMLTREHAKPPLDFSLLQKALKRTDPTVEVVMIARKVPSGVLPKFGYAVHLLTELYHVATSRVLVVDGYSPVASGVSHGSGLTIIQVWHGLGALKKFGRSILGRDEGRHPWLARAVRMHRNYDLVLASAERCRVPFAEAFGTDVSRVVVAPLPRVDRLRDPAARTRARERFDRRHPGLVDARIALFAPTFRLDGEPAADIGELSRAIGAAGFTLVTKLHPLNADTDGDETFAAPGFSTQDLILIADVFITDYSSAVFEAAVAGVPCFLLATDLERYSMSRDFYLAYPGDLGLPFATDAEGLVAAIGSSADAASRTAELARRFVETDGAGPTANADAIARLVLARVPNQ